MAAQPASQDEVFYEDIQPLLPRFGGNRRPALERQPAASKFSSKKALATAKPQPRATPATGNASITSFMMASSTEKENLSPAFTDALGTSTFTATLTSGNIKPATPSVAGRSRRLAEIQAALDDEPAKTARDRRLAAIQAALDQLPSPSEPAPPIAAQPQPSFGGTTKRPLSSTSDTSLEQPPMAKRPHSSSASPSLINVRQQVVLTREQQEVLSLIQQGRGVFFTGSAGCGKSVLVREIIRSLSQKWGQSAVGVTASTGIAAASIGGTTLHTFCGFGIGKQSSSDLARIVRKQPAVLQRWRLTKALLIDEVSMVDGAFFDKVVEVSRLLDRESDLQFVLSGDFFQLPPVASPNQPLPIFAFEANSWSQVVHHTIELTQVFRQRDAELVAMLNEVRLGRSSHASTKLFASLSRAVDWNDGIEPTQLFPHRADVNDANRRRLDALPGSLLIFRATDQGNSALGERLLVPEELRLKIGAQVMLVKNADAGEGLVNGAMGTVIDFWTWAEYQQQYPLLAAAQTSPPQRRAGTQYPLVQFVVTDALSRKVAKRHRLTTPESWTLTDGNGGVQLRRTQVPLVLSWAMSIHKSQGQTIERVCVNLGSVFEKGQAYVALSRASSLDGLQVVGFDPGKVQAHPRVIEWSRNFTRS